MSSNTGCMIGVIVGMKVGVALVAIASHVTYTGIDILVGGRFGNVAYAVGGFGENLIGVLVGFAIQAPSKTINTNQHRCTLILLLFTEVNPKSEQAG